VRKLFEARLRVLSGRPLTVEQVSCASAFQELVTRQKILYVTAETVHSARRRSLLAGALILPHLTELAKGKYLRRWARRLREEGFSREDALILANATFGVDQQRKTLGAEVIITTDLGLVTKFNGDSGHIEARLRRMTAQLKPPHAGARIPDVVTPDDVMGVLEESR
jgi:hypothetical protein